MKEDKRIFKAGYSDETIRLDKFLSWKLPEFSRSEIQKFAIERVGGGKAVKLSDKVKLNEEFIVTVVTNKLVPIQGQSASDFNVELDILFEDDDLIVINKPRGISMYPGAGRATGTLVQMLLDHCSLSTIGGGMRPGVVHRLDKDTSGVVVFAKSDAAFRGLSKIFEMHSIIRKYIAFAWGVPSWESADISGNIARSTKNRQKMTMVKIGGKEAKTQVDVINAWPQFDISEFRCTLFTGRTHQIRVHLSGHGFPVLCDPLYGRGNSRLGTIKDPELLGFIREHDGQMLHAETLEFTHPVTGKKLKFKSKLPHDMQYLKTILNSNQ